MHLTLCNLSLNWVELKSSTGPRRFKTGRLVPSLKTKLQSPVSKKLQDIAPAVSVSLGSNRIDEMELLNTPVKGQHTLIY